MRAKPFLIGLFALVVIIAAASVYFATAVRKVDKSVSAFKSPDGRYKAVRVSLSRGGNDAFCFDSIAIFLTVYPDEFAESEKVYEVYRRPCARPAERTSLPKIEWLSNTALRISYPPADEVDPGKLLMAPIDASKYVHITYAAAK